MEKTERKWLTERNMNAMAGLLFAGMLSLFLFGLSRWPLTAFPVVLVGAVLFSQGPLQPADPRVTPTLTHKLVRFLVVTLGTLICCAGANLSTP